MKNCNLCKLPARTYCESDQANLCWDCDAKVHGANFLVARHSRTLLCGTCQSLTPWKASGAKLGHTVTVCQRCAGAANDEMQEREESEGANDDEIHSEDDEDDGGGEDDDDGDADNQVVPWSSTPPPPAASSSSSASSEDECVNAFSLKRARESSTNLRSLLQEHIHREYGTSEPTTQAAGGDGEATSVDCCLYLRPSKDQRTEPDRSLQAARSVKRSRQSRSDGKLSEESEAFDGDSSGNSSRTI